MEKSDGKPVSRKVFSKEDIEELKGVLEKYNDGTNN